MRTAIPVSNATTTVTSSGFTDAHPAHRLIQLKVVMAVLTPNFVRLRYGSPYRQASITASNGNLKGYLHLVDWAGRIVREDKTGFIPASSLRVLIDGLSGDDWRILTLDIQKLSISMMG